MSLAYRNKHKAKKRERTEDQKSVASRIRNGKMPKFHFAKTGDSLERVKGMKGLRPVMRLTWRLLSTYKILTED